MGDWHINRATREKGRSLGDTKIRWRPTNPSSGLYLQPPIPVPPNATPLDRDALRGSLIHCEDVIVLPDPRYIPYKPLAQSMKFYSERAIPPNKSLSF